MKKSWRLLLLLVLIPFSISCNNILEVELDAQTFPATVHAEVDPPLATDLVVAIGVSLDSGSVSLTPIVVVTCTLPGSTTTLPCVKSAPFTVPDGNPHTAHVTFVNSFGPSTSLDLVFKATVSAKPSNGTIKGGSQ